MDLLLTRSPSFPQSRCGFLPPVAGLNQYHMHYNPLKRLVLAGLLGLSAIVGSRAADTTALFGTNTLFIEAEDVDYGHGQFVTTAKIGMNGAYPGGSYKGLGTADDL